VESLNAGEREGTERESKQQVSFGSSWLQTRNVLCLHYTECTRKKFIFCNHIHSILRRRCGCWRGCSVHVCSKSTHAECSDALWLPINYWCRDADARLERANTPRSRRTVGWLTDGQPGLKGRAS